MRAAGYIALIVIVGLLTIAGAQIVGDAIGDAFNNQARRIEEAAR